MGYPLSRTVVPDLRVLDSATSTNSELLALAATGVASFTTVLTLDQTAGRGRLDRSWVAPREAALALSVLVRDALGHPLATWIPLVAGLALTEALDEIAPGRVGLKWPNDVLLDGGKVSGILCEVVPGTRDVVVGAGLNLEQTAAELPVASATSLRLAGLPRNAGQLDALIAAYLRRLRAELESTDRARLRSRVVARCATVGLRVRVTLADGETVDGVATGIDHSGRLEVAPDGADPVAVAVGDVTHVRPA